MFCLTDYKTQNTIKVEQTLSKPVTTFKLSPLPLHRTFPHFHANILSPASPIRTRLI